ncbi:hypothetical protein B0H63DRAFT_524498 [Podospora didyma]|uniref:N-acetyltransferase domain-containing protein n=1 Tax=Podospora didyma TaxID=330526 RepID=A0AAE0NHZ8_9PEZI|nr:hypothetical protein B0H63DRAFT_524498 [Podospora didyma]
MSGNQALPQSGTGAAFKLRATTEKDLGAITVIHIEGLIEDPQDMYCLPGRDEHVGEHWKWAREEYWGYVQQPDRYYVFVLEEGASAGVGAGAGAGTAANPTIVGFAVWDVAVLTNNAGQNARLVVRGDANTNRCEAVEDTAATLFSVHFAQWSESQAQLVALVVLPAFRPRGGGTKLANCGINFARENGWPATQLCWCAGGSRSGGGSRVFFEHLGFVTVATEVVRVQGEEEWLVCSAMVRYPPAQGEMP